MISESIKKHRKRLGWSQQKLAGKTGLAYVAINKLEQGPVKGPAIQTAIIIADTFHISIDKLIGRKIILGDKDERKE